VLTKKTGLLIAASLILVSGAMMLIWGKYQSQNQINVKSMPLNGVATASASSQVADTTPKHESKKKSSKPIHKPKKQGKILIAGQSSYQIDGCNLTLQSVKKGIAVIQVVKPNMAITQLENLTAGSMIRFATADVSYYLTVGSVGKNSVEFSVRRG